MVEAQLLSNGRRFSKKWLDFCYGSEMSMQKQKECLAFTKREQEMIKVFLEDMDSYSLKSARFRRLNRKTQFRRVDMAARKALLRNGKRLFRILRRATRVPVSSLRDLFGDDFSLHLTLDEQTRKFPWELAYDGQSFLCNQYDVGRRPLHDIGKIERYSGSKPEHRKALVVGLSYKWLSDEPFTSKREALQVAKQLSKKNYSSILLRDEKASCEEVMNVLSEGVSIFHFTGHGAYRKNQPRGKRGLIQLYDGNLTEDDLAECFRKAKGAPFLTFLNACQSAKEIYSSPMMDMFIELGAECTIGTLWSVYDYPSTRFSERFYSEIVNGQTIGHALQLARWSIQKRSFTEAATWPSFVLYGNPDLRLSRAP